MSEIYSPGFIPGPAGPQGPAGPPANFAGTYSNGTTYAAGQAVSYTPDGSSYISLANGNAGNQPDTSPAWWGLLASPGGMAPAVTSAIGAAVAAVNPTNVLNPANVTAGFFLASTGAAQSTGGSFAAGVTGLIPMPAGTQFVVNFSQSAMGFGDAVGMAYYNNGTLVSVAGYGTGAFASGHVFTMPAGTNQVQLTIAGAFTASTLMVWEGTTLPSIFVPYQQAFPVTTAAEATVSLPALESTVTALGAAIAAASPTNLLNLANVQTAYFLNTSGVAQATGGGFTAGVTGLIPIAAGTQFVVNFSQSAMGFGDAVGMAYYNNGGLVSFVGYGTGAFAAGHVFTVPSGANQVQLTISGTFTASTLMLWEGTILPTIAVPYQQPFSMTVAAEFGATNSTASTLAATVNGLIAGSANPLAGKKFALFADSIGQILGNYWQNQLIARTGMVEVYQNAQSGRKIAQIFADYNGAGSTFVMPSGSTGYLGTTPGNTLAQDLTAAAPDVIVIALGTNDGTTTLGSPGDSATAATLYGEVLNAVNTIAAAYPSAQILWTTPYQYNPADYGGGTGGGNYATNLAIVNAIKTVCGSYGVTVNDILENSTLNQYNWSLYLGDGVHINPAGANAFYVPRLAGVLKGMF
jgi:lysophospholipase L1-like esterase